MKIDKQKIIQEYINGKTMKQLKEEYLLSDLKIEDILKDARKLKRRIEKTERKEKAEKAVKLYNGGVVIKEIANQLNSTDTTIRTYLEAAGVYERKNRNVVVPTISRSEPDVKVKVYRPNLKIGQIVKLKEVYIDDQKKQAYYYKEIYCSWSI